MQKTSLLAAGLAALLLNSCFFGSPLSTRVNSSPLARAPKEIITPVESARRAYGVATDGWENAQLLTKSALRAVELARAELDVVTREVDRARRNAATASEGDNPSVAALMERTYTDLTTTAEIARLGLALAKRESDVAQLRELLAVEEAALAEARLELAAGRAIERLDLPPEQAVALADLRGQERHQLAEVERANERLSAARVAMQRAREAYDGAIKAVQAAERL